MNVIINFTKALFKAPISQDNIDPLNFIGIVITIIVSLYIFKNETSITFIKERHDKLFFPLFNLLEPILYQKVNYGTLGNALSIISSNKNLADGKLLELYYNCCQSSSQKNFNALCSYVDSEYDKSCKKLGLKKRSLMYRCARHQYQNMFFLISDFIGHILVLIFLVSIAYILLIFYVTAIVTTFTSADNVERLALFFISIFFLSKIISYFSKRI